MELSSREGLAVREMLSVLTELCGRPLPQAADELAWPVLIHDGARVLYVNPAGLRWFRCGGDGALVFGPLAGLARPEDERPLLAALGALADEPPDAPHLQRFCDQAGATLLGRVASSRVRFGAATATLALIKPVSSADRSAELSAWLRAAVDHLTDIVFITEAHAIDGVGRRIVFVNRAFTRTSGYEPLEVLGKTPNITIGEGTDRETLTRIEAALAGTQPVREDLLKYRKDGSAYWVELQILPVFDDAGRHTHWISIQRDLSERKQLEARLLESARLAASGQLSISLASEINTPLASVVSSLEWLSDSLPALLHHLGDDAEREVAQVLEALADARGGARRIADATSHLELLGSIGGGARQTQPLAPLIEQALSDAEHQLGRPLPVQSSLEDDLVVTADAGRLRHALRLALVNAALVSGRERSLRLHACATPEGLCVSVDDAGPGVTPELSGPLSAPFAVRRPPGIADSLGLFVASRLIAELGGELVLTPQPTGTRVEVRLPYAD